MKAKAARATHPEARGQKCNPWLFYVMAGILIIAVAMFLVVRPGHDRNMEKTPAAPLSTVTPTAQK